MRHYGPCSNDAGYSNDVGFSNDVGYSNEAGFSNDAGYSDDAGSITGTTLDPSRKRRWIVHLNDAGPLIQTTLYSAKTTLDSPV